MATLTGAGAAVTPVGTADDDVLIGMGTNDAAHPDLLIGGEGADEYRLDREAGAVHACRIDDGGNGGGDSITRAGALYQSASLGYQGWATAERIGEDRILHLPSKPYRFRDPAKPAFDIEIRGQYAGHGVETIEAGGIVYALRPGGTGAADILTAGAGSDWVFGNRGRDSLDLGTGDDTAFGGHGRDRIAGGAGAGRIFGDAGNDLIDGGADGDRIEGGEGRDSIGGGSGNDILYGEAGEGRLFGGDGDELLSGGSGNNLMVGGKGADTYRFGDDLDTLGTVDPAGADRIVKRGDAESWTARDRIDLFGFYGPSEAPSNEAFARLSFARDGQDMVVSADGGAWTLTVSEMFGASQNHGFVEELRFNGACWDPLLFQILSEETHAIGDDRNHGPVHRAELNEIIFGTDGDDRIFGCSGTNFV